jgi:RNA polymerase sigma-70 factor (ECF subfamily)
MNGDTTQDLRDLIERLRSGDESARREILDRVYHRLQRITAAMFQRDFPRLQARHELNSVVDEAWIRLTRALETTQPASPAEFYGLMFHKVRQVLLDLASRQTREDARFLQLKTDSDGQPGGSQIKQIADSTHDPARLAFWTEFHQQVESLPTPQKMVFDFHYLAEIPQVEIARLLDLHPKQVSRLWIAATVRLASSMEGIEGLR